MNFMYLIKVFRKGQKELISLVEYIYFSFVTIMAIFAMPSITITFHN